MRTVDKTKKSNIKCEHCENFDASSGICSAHNAKRNYWNRCAEFNWHHRYDRVKGE